MTAASGGGQGPAGSNERVRLFLRDFIMAPDNADIDVSIGHVAETVEALVIVTITAGGRQTAGIGLPREDATALADIAAKAGGEYPRSGLTRLALGLRMVSAAMGRLH